MTTYEGLAIAATYVVMLAGFAAWSYNVRERANMALSEAQKNTVRIDGIDARLSRVDQHYDTLTEQIGELQEGMARVEEQMKMVNQSLTRLANGGL